MEFRDGDLVVRRYRLDDAEPLATVANSRKVTAFLADIFPNPYGLMDAEKWIAETAKETRPCNFAIEWQGRLVGGIGFMPLKDVHHRTADIGYWLGEDYWGKGLATRAVKLVLPYAFGELGFIRIQGLVFANNPASMRVLEKAGFVREGVMNRHVVKRGEVHDAVMYAMIKPD